MSPVPLSILDLAPISEGADARTALAHTLDLARRAEAWGFSRYWLAEHHFAAVASSSPAVLIGAVAAATRTIRVGSAAVQLGTTTAAAVTEAFGTLDALYPGRIDLGLGRSGHRRAEALAAVSGERGPAVATRTETEIREGVVLPPPFDASRVLASPLLTAAAGVLQQPGARSPDFAEQVDDILALLRGTYLSPDGVALRAVPGTAADVQVWLFGSSAGASAQLAGRLGLPFGANYHVSPATTLDAVAAYRAAFRPGVLPEPYVVVSADAVVAESDDRAAELVATYPNWTHSIRSGNGAVAYPDPATTPPLTEEEYALVHDRVVTQFAGAPTTVADRLDRLRALTGADELLVTGITHAHADRVRSYELLAAEWGLAGAAAA
ncbi:LLM class flavin-dependent oxidoreductase [Rhodococcus rhodnii]|uniref:Alkanal monooxygenase alpha subunit n=2 Tax=Rhodococcus rhodnii TaxID=38312 RepID=R7WRQ3_9NOCA|nr:LLM class flavin-dependent oxidoreductase [Rhodococcus rhodnii]EOM77998.1 alkanal monooxygenase alpha subunit [Rhodococcus rhodnii LMG 5362]TXG92059.1 LLM class flavin-dependent oxidoreductase [Rhodococcus rhodnii]